MIRNLHIISPHAPKALENIFSHDLYFLIQELKLQGIAITLHIPFLEQIDPKTYESTNQLYRYQNSNESNSGEVSFQFIHEALENLQTSDGPILFYGNLQSFIHLKNKVAGKRKLFYRQIINEVQNTKELAQLQPWGLHKIKTYLKINQLNALVQKLDDSDIHCLVDQTTSSDLNTCKTEIPFFAGMPFAFFQESNGSFCLFHGNLDEKENEYAAFWLLKHVFNTLEIPFVIAGANPSEELEKAAHLRMHTCLVANPTNSELHELIKKAQVNLLPTFVSKRKDMNLYRCLNLGKHILTNNKGVPSHFRNESITITESPDNFIKKIPQLFEQRFGEENHNKRMDILNNLYQDQISAQKLIRLLF